MSYNYHKVNKGNQNLKQDTQSEPISQPFKGSEDTIKNLSTFPEGSGDKEDLLSQVAPGELTQPENQQQSQPAQTEEGSNESK